MEYTREALEDAIVSRDLQRVREILVHEPPLIDQKTGEGVPFALEAAAGGNLELVKYIVEYSRASMDITDENHRNILHYGAVSGNTQLCRYLVERVGMRPDSGDRDLITPLDVAHEAGFTKLEEYFCGVLGAPLSEMYRNPIRTGMYPDPSIVRVGEDYYMVNSSFIFFPCIPISHSRDLIHWEIIGHAITNPQWAALDELEGGRGYWAPDISYDNGIYYITATYRLNDTGTVYRKQMVVSSERPEGPYSEPVFLDEDGIDPSIFHEDGHHYMLLNRGARIFELSADCKKQISGARLLYYGSNKRAPEGSHLLKKDGWYYLFQAEGGTGMGHRITVARSRELMGVYEPCPYNPIMRQSDEEAGIQRCGHGKPVCTQNGEWYIPYLCGRLAEKAYSILGRETALDPITWTADGWPLVNEGRGPSVLQKRPNLPVWKPGKGSGIGGRQEEMSAHTGMEAETELFAKGKLSGQWMSPRPMEEDAVRFHDGYLWLKANRYPLSGVKAHNILLRRQTDFCFEAWTKVKLETLAADCRRDKESSRTKGREYGLICYYDENTWVSCAVSPAAGGGFAVQVKEHIGLEDRVHPAAAVRPSGDELVIGVETCRLQRCFYVCDGADGRIEAARLEQVSYLCDEGIRMGKRFTGAMVGIYAYGEGEPFYAGFSEFGYRKGVNTGKWERLR